MRISDWSSDVCSSDLDEDVAMGELGQVPSNQAETERRVHPAAHGGEFLGLLHQAEMSAAANQRIVMTGVVRKGGNGRAQEGKRLPEAPRRQQRQAVNRGVEAKIGSAHG